MDTLNASINQKSIIDNTAILCRWPYHIILLNKGASGKMGKKKLRMLVIMMMIVSGATGKTTISSTLLSVTTRS